MGDKPQITNLATPVLFVLIVALAFVVGVLWTRVQMLESGQVTPKLSLGQGAVGSGTQSGGSVTGQVAAATADDLKKRDDDHIRGNKNARILLVEYSDLECPFCKRFHDTANQIIKEYDGKVAWVYRHFPIDSLHSKADKEAEAIECAGELGGNDVFWKFADKIFEVTPSNNGLNLEDLPKLAGEVGLDTSKFKSCLDSGKFAQQVEEDYQHGLKVGVTGTPGNFLVDTKTGNVGQIRGALPFEQVKPMIDSMLKES